MILELDMECCIPYSCDGPTMYEHFRESDWHDQYIIGYLAYVVSCLQGQDHVDVSISQIMNGAALAAPVASWLKGAGAQSIAYKQGDALLLPVDLPSRYRAARFASGGASIC